MKVIELKNAIARLQIKILAIKLAAMFQPIDEGLLHHFSFENLALEVVDGIILGMTESGKVEGYCDGPKGHSRPDNPHHVQSPRPTTAIWGEDITPEIEGLPRCVGHRIVRDPTAIGRQADITWTPQIGHS
jgi:hypothetical protein